jgi:hypothetical protein
MNRTPNVNYKFAYICLYQSVHAQAFIETNFCYIVRTQRKHKWSNICSAIHTMPYTPPTNRVKRSPCTRCLINTAKANVDPSSLTGSAETAIGESEVGGKAPPKEDLRKDSVCSADEYREASAALWGSDYTRRKCMDLNTGTAANVTTSEAVCRGALSGLI